DGALANHVANARGIFVAGPRERPIEWAEDPAEQEIDDALKPVAVIGVNRDDRAFPLNPTLSPGERENSSQCVGQSSAPGFSRDERRFPLPMNRSAGLRPGEFLSTDSRRVGDRRPERSVQGFNARTLFQGNLSVLVFLVWLEQDRAERRRERQRVE